MKTIKVVFAMAIALTLSACASSEPVSRSFAPSFPVGTAPASLFVDSINIQVPKTLSVSEAHLFYPLADIVWRGDPRGDRHAQIAAIFNDGMTRGAAVFKGDQHVVVDVEVLRFHSLTERARYTFGGVHSIKFIMTVRDADTGAFLREPAIIKADLNGYGGARAIAAEERGLTQKVRVTHNLAAVLQRELTALSIELGSTGAVVQSSTPSLAAQDDAA